MSMLSLLSSLSGMFGGNQSAPGVPFANRNLFVDGNKDVWNGTSSTLAAAAAYTASVMTIASCGTGGAGTYAQGTIQPGAAGTFGFSRPARFYGLFSQTTASTGTLAAFTGPLLYQRIEDVSATDGAALTLSVWLWTASGTLNVTQAFITQYFGAGGSPSASVNTAIPVNWTLTTTPQRFSVLINVPSVAGKTIGTTTPGFTSVGFCLPVGSTYGVVDAQWQLEYCSPNASSSITGNGGAPTTFEYRGQEVELGRVQRFYETGLQPTLFMSVYPTGGATAYGDVRFSTTKRVAPTVTIGTGWQYFSSGVNTAFTPSLSSVVDKFTYTAGSLTNWDGWAGVGTFIADARL